MIPGNARAGRLILKGGAETYPVKIGHLDPVDETTGIPVLRVPSAPESGMIRHYVFLEAPACRPAVPRTLGSSARA